MSFRVLIFQSVSVYLLYVYISCRLLLYLSLFGFTMDPRIYRYRYQSTAAFLHHLQVTTKLQPHEWMTPSKAHPSPVHIHLNHSHTTVSVMRRKTAAPNGSIGNENSNTVDYSKELKNGNLTLSYILLAATAHEVRSEVDTLVSDLVVRLKQLLFNSLLCAYYTGFIPMQFVDVSMFMCMCGVCVCVCVCGGGGGWLGGSTTAHVVAVFVCMCKCLCI